MKKKAEQRKTKYFGRVVRDAREPDEHTDGTRHGSLRTVGGVSKRGPGAPSRAPKPHQRTVDDLIAADGSSGRNDQEMIRVPAARGPLLPSSNWEAIKSSGQHKSKYRGNRSQSQYSKDGSRSTSGSLSKSGPAALSDTGETILTDVVAMDCEMVGIQGNKSVLARVCIVNNCGHVLLDAYCRPRERIVDFRTRVSGIRPSDLRDAPPFEEVQRRAHAILKNRIVVGHSIKYDFSALKLDHPRHLIRDTAHYPPLMAGYKSRSDSTEGARGESLVDDDLLIAKPTKLRSRSLKILAAEQLGLEIQTGEHTPVEDARCALYVYHRHRKEWEKELAAGRLTGPETRIKPTKVGGKLPAGAKKGHGKTVRKEGALGIRKDVMKALRVASCADVAEPHLTVGRQKRKEIKAQKAVAALAHAFQERPELYDL